MSETTQPLGSLRATWNWSLYVLGLIGSVMAVAAIVRRGFGIDLFGLPRTVLAEYERYRDFVFSVVPLHLQPWLKDCLVAYLAIGAAHFRTYPREIIDGTSLVLILYLAWPINLIATVIDIKDGYQSRKAVEVLTTWMLNLGLMIAATICFFAWNYVSR